MTTEEKKLAPDGREYVTLDLDMTHLFPRYEEFNKTIPKSPLTCWQRKVASALALIAWSVGMLMIGQNLGWKNYVPPILISMLCCAMVDYDTHCTMRRVIALATQGGKMEGGKIVKDFIIGKLVEEGHAETRDMPSVREEAES